MQYLILLFLMCSSIFAGQLDISGKVPLDSGTKPFCVLDKDNNLHVAYTKGGIKYLKVSPLGDVSDKETLSTDNGDNPWLTVDTKGNVHVVWDIGKACFYKKKEGNTWGSTINLPTPRTAWNETPQVAADKDGVAFWSFVGIDSSSIKIPPSSSYYGVIEGGAAKTIYSHTKESNARPPALLGPDSRNAGDGKVYYFVGGQQVSWGEFIDQKPEENIFDILINQNASSGFHAIWADSIILFMNAGHKHGLNGVEVNNLSKDMRSILAGETNSPWPFPRGAYDKKYGVAYFLFSDSNESASLQFWNPVTDSISTKVKVGTVTSGGKGCGAGGIAATPWGGVYVVYSESGMLQRVTVGTSDSTVVGVKQNINNTMNQLAVYKNGKKVYIKAKDIASGSASSVHIFNYNGTEVASLPLTQDGNVHWNTESVPVGVYMITLHINGKRRSTEKISLLH
ncbi:MAG: hypothetical protein HQK83_07525 [Fibrobacteria bacterium]|nr:hypothetical protein [Fibrobacteria bacterium]